MISRRAFVAVSLAAPALIGSRAAMAEPAPHEWLAALEAKHGGRLGVAILDTARSAPVAYRGDERFALCSTFKNLVAACVLARVDARLDSLDRRVVYGKGDLMAYAPVTGKHLGDGMTVGALCEAAVTVSDNTAANMLLASFGGPPGLTAYLRTLGDTVTRLDRFEPDLNENKPGDPRDTTTPLAMAATLQKVVVGTALSEASRTQLAEWLVECKTGGKRLRAGVPKDWRAGDKSGSGANNATNDVAVIWPPNRAPVVVTAYYTGSPAPADERDAVLAEVGKIAASL